MNFKKMFGIVATVAMMTSMVPVTTFGYSVSDEMQAAYDYAYEVGVTTKDSAETANLTSQVTRAEMAKMITVFAEDVLGLVPNASDTACAEFTDVSSAQGDLEAYITSACQLGLMGRNNDGTVATKFNPAGNLTRAQYGTLLSRALYGDVNNGGNPRYANHLQALNDDGIMTNISNPNVLELRRWVMKTLQTADESGVATAAGCNDPLTIAACAVGDSSCPAACETPEVAKSGSLNVTLTDYSSSVKSAPLGGTMIFNAVKFASSEEVTVNTVTLERVGLSSRSDIDSVWFEKDGVAVSSKGTVATDGKVSVVFNKGLVVKSSDTLDLVVKLKGTTAGAEIAFKFVDVTSTAASVNADATTTTYRTAAYTVGALAYEALTGAAVSYKLGDQTTYEFGQFSLTNSSSGTDDKAILVKAISLKNDGTSSSNIGDILTDVEVLRDGKVVSTKVTFNGSVMTVALNDTITAAKKATYTIQAKIASLADGAKSVHLYLNKDTDIVSYETSTNFRATVTEGVDNFRTYTITGGKIILTSEAGFATTVEAGQGYTDAVIAKGTLTLAEPIKFDLNLVGSANATGVKSMTLEIGGSRYPATINTEGTGFTFADVYVSKTAAVKLLISTTATAINNSTITFNAIQGANMSNGEYQNNATTFSGQAVVAGSISVSNVNVKAPTFTIKNNASSTVSIIKNTSSTVTIFDGELSSTNGTVSVSDLTLSNASGTIGTDSISLTLYVDGVAKSTLNYTTGSVTFNSIGNVGSTPKSIKIEALPTVTTTGSFTFDVAAAGTINGNSATTNTTQTAKLNITAAGSASISTTSQGSKVVIDGSNAQLATFDVYVQNGSVAMTGITLTGTGLPATFTLNVDGQSYNGVLSGGDLVITGMNKTLAVGSHTFSITSNMNTDNVTGGTAVTLTNVALAIDGTSVSKTLASTYLFVKAFPTLSLKSITINQFVVTIANTTAKPMTLTTFSGANTSGLVYINDQERIYALSPSQYVTINPGQSVDATFKVVAAGVGKFLGIAYDVVDNGFTYSYDLNNAYTNFPWGTFQQTYTN